ncbi:MAG: pilus assembly protein PilP [Myxococcota bacterium]
MSASAALNALLSVSLFALIGCTGNTVGGTVNTPKRPPIPPGQSTNDALDAAIAEQAGYNYTPQGKRDPFRSFITVEQAGPELEQLGPLQTFEVDQYSLVAIVWNTARPMALAEDPDGTGHVMERGTYIGRNWGKVTQINADHIIITEEYQTIDGELSVDTIRLDLPVEDL